MKQDALHVLLCPQQGGELNVVFVVAVAHGHAARLHVVLRQHVFYFQWGPNTAKLTRVGHNL